jgi:hypothetical protein
MSRGCPTCYEVFQSKTQNGTVMAFCPKDGTPMIEVFCTRCGNSDLNDEDPYCISCGEKLDYQDVVNQGLSKFTI